MRKLPPIRTMMAVIAVVALASFALQATEAPLRTAGGIALDVAARTARDMADRTVPSAFAQDRSASETSQADSLDRRGAGAIRRHGNLPPDDALGKINRVKLERDFGRSGNVLRFGSDVTVAPDQVIDGDLVVMAADIVVEGHVEGDVVALGGDVTLRSTAKVDGDVACMGGVLTEDPGAYVGGQRVTASGIGDVMRARSERAHQRAARAAMRRVAHFVGDVVWLLIMLGLAWAFTALAPDRTRAAVRRLKESPGASVGVGALVWALVIPSIVALALIVAILCITIIGIPLALAALLGYCLFLILTYLWGYVVASVVVGEWILNRSVSRSASMTGAAAPAAPPSLTRMAVVGVLVLGGLRVIGSLMRGLWFIGWLGGLIAALAWAAIAVAATFGGGAWLHTEFTTGTLGRWWHGRRGRNGGGAPPTGGAPAPGPPPPPAGPPPPAAPSPPSPFAAPPPSGAEVIESGSPPPPAGGTPPETPPATPGT